MSKKSKKEKFHFEKKSLSYRNEFSYVNILIVFFTAFLIYSNTLTNFYALDDSMVITENQFTQMGLKAIPKILSTDSYMGHFGMSYGLSGGRYRPLTLITFAIEYEFFQTSPHISHFVNALLYALTCAMLFLVLQKIFLSYNTILPLVISLLFAVHPIHTEVVANIKSRDEILCLLFLLLTILYLLRYADTANEKTFIISIIFFLLALLSKENAITFLAVVPFTLYLFRNISIKKNIFYIIPFFCVAVIFILLRSHIIGYIGMHSTKNIMNNPFVDTTFSQKYGTIIFILWKYVALLFFPHPLMFDYSYNQIPLRNFTQSEVIFSMLVNLLLLAFGIIFIRKKSRNPSIKNLIAYGIFVYYITLSISSNIFFPIGAPMGERFLFLPSLGFCIAIGVLLVTFFRIDIINKDESLMKNSSFAFTIAVLLIAGTVKTLSRNTDWKNNLSLFSHDVKYGEQNAMINKAYGNVMIEASQKTDDPLRKREYLLDGMNYLRKAIQIYPVYSEAIQKLGFAFYTIAQYDSAIKYYNEAIRISPFYVQAYINLGVAYHMKGGIPTAMALYKKAIDIQPTNADAYYNLSVAYLNLQQYDDVISNALKAVELNPNYTNAYGNLSNAYSAKKDFEKAKYYYEKAKQLQMNQK